MIIPYFVRRVVAALPPTWQAELKRLRFARQIRAGQFGAGEPEYDILQTLFGPGDWVIDIGANVGHYTLRLAELVGPGGRVLALEPVPATFRLLAANAALVAKGQITLMNLAASEVTQEAAIVVPTVDCVENYYQAHLSASDTGQRVLCVAIDSLGLRHRVSLVKIDAEGHEGAVLRGMRALLERDGPTLIVEDNGDPDGSVQGVLQDLGYRAEKLAGSPNQIFRRSLRSGRGIDRSPGASAIRLPPGPKLANRTPPAAATAIQRATSATPPPK